MEFVRHFEIRQFITQELFNHTNQLSGLYMPFRQLCAGWDKQLHVFTADLSVSIALIEMSNASAGVAFCVLSPGRNAN